MKFIYCYFSINTKLPQQEMSISPNQTICRVQSDGFSEIEKILQMNTYVYLFYMKYYSLLFCRKRLTYFGHEVTDCAW